MNPNSSYDSERLLEHRDYDCDCDSFSVGDFRAISLHLHGCGCVWRFSSMVLSFLCHDLIYALPHSRNWVNGVDLNSIYG